jgi:hypothetical protein
MNTNEIGIGILDLYTQENLDLCYQQIPESLKSNVFIVSNNKNKSPISNSRSYSIQVPMATMRNWLISQMRIKNYKYYFLIHSNQFLKNQNLFEETIKLAETFGTWFILGNGSESNQFPLEDDVEKITLYLNSELKSEFMFIFSGIIKNNGYFDERYLNGKDVDVLDYVCKLRDKKVYPPNGYHPTIPSSFQSDPNSNINKTGYNDIPSVQQDVQLTYAYFFNNHKYIPTQNDPPIASQQDLLNIMEHLQQNYGKKQNRTSTDNV